MVINVCSAAQQERGPELNYQRKTFAVAEWGLKWEVGDG